MHYVEWMVCQCYLHTHDDQQGSEQLVLNCSCLEKTMHYVEWMVCQCYLHTHDDQQGSEQLVLNCSCLEKTMHYVEWMVCQCVRSWYCRTAVQERYYWQH